MSTDLTANTNADNSLGNGFLANQRIMRHYDPTSADHRCITVQSVVEVKRADARTFADQLEIWEWDIRTFQSRAFGKIQQDWLTKPMLRQLPVKFEVNVDTSRRHTLRTEC